MYQKFLNFVHLNKNKTEYLEGISMCKSNCILHSVDMSLDSLCGPSDSTLFFKTMN